MSVRPGSSYPSDGGSSGDSWAIRADNVSDKARRITGYAVCSSELTVTYVPSSPINLPTNLQVSANAACPGEAPNVVGGGQVNSAAIGDLRLYRDFPDNQPTTDRWVSDMENEGPPTSYTVWASCVENL